MHKGNNNSITVAYSIITSKRKDGICTSFPDPSSPIIGSLPLGITTGYMIFNSAHTKNETLQLCSDYGKHLPHNQDPCTFMKDQRIQV